MMFDGALVIQHFIGQISRLDRRIQMHASPRSSCDRFRKSVVTAACQYGRGLIATCRNRRKLCKAVPRPRKQPGDGQESQQADDNNTDGYPTPKVFLFEHDPPLSRAKPDFHCTGDSSTLLIHAFCSKSIPC